MAEQGSQRLGARPRLGLRARVGYDREGKCLMCVTLYLDPTYTGQVQPVAVIENDAHPVFGWFDAVWRSHGVVHLADSSRSSRSSQCIAH